MTWGLVALFVMFSVYGIVRLSQSVLFNNKDVNTIDIPSFDPKKANKNSQTGPSVSPGFQPGSAR